VYVCIPLSRKHFLKNYENLIRKYISLFNHIVLYSANIYESLLNARNYIIYTHKLNVYVEIYLIIYMYICTYIYIVRENKIVLVSLSEGAMGGKKFKMLEIENY
jgi:hypothetical protein